MPLPPGTRLGPYEITTALGAGGMGEVYRARDSRLGRDVALKLLPEAFARDAERLARFEREARTVAALNHPNIVVLHSIEEAAGVRFLTMEMVEGRTLTERVRPGGLPIGEVLDVAIPLAEAMVAAHEQGVVHRDLKPANVMLTRDGRVKVLDFGLAKLTQTADESGTQAPTRSLTLSVAGGGMGTIPYMSPEQIRGEPADARSDLFSFGILIYELATGRRPFTGDSAADVTSAILRDPPPSLASARTDLPHDLDRILGRCLEKNPRDRLQTALDVANELERLQRALDLGALPDSPGAIVVASPTAASPGERVRRAWLVAAAVLAAAAIAGGSFLLRPAEDPRGASAADKLSVAVLEFENVTGDASLDWMKRGVSELLAAALVQSPRLDVFDAQRLGDLAAADRAAPLAAPTVAVLARHDIHRALTGSMVEA